MEWFDGHLDLALLAETGRDMHVEPGEARGRYTPAAVTLPSLASGGVRRALATVFTEGVADPSAPGAETGAFAYPLGDRDKAYVAGMRQLLLYRAWRDAGLISLPGEGGAAPLRVGVLVENADPIGGPEELDEWVRGGVVAIGLTWATRGRHACGNTVDSSETDSGLTGEGRALVARMDELGLVHDASHLNDRSLDELFGATDRMVVATHSNSREVMGDGRERHLTDGAIREIARRGGVIGLNLCSSFLHPSCWGGGRASIDDAVRHVEHVCEVAGDRAHVGLGSDMDGGFAADRLPEGIDAPADLARIAEALRGRGWSDGEIAGFARGNWARVFPGV